MPRELVIQNFAQIAHARIGLGELSVLVGPQGTGKSLALQWLKLAVDGNREPLEWLVIEEPEMGLHPKGIMAVLLLVFELLSRGYKVVLSTHAPLILNVLWAIRLLHGRRGAPKRVLDIFDQPSNPGTRKLAEAELEARTAVTYLDFDSKQRVHSKDISGLALAAVDDSEAGWGGLMDFNSRIAERLSAAVEES